MRIYNADPRIMWTHDLFLRKPSRALTKEEVLSKEFKDILQLLFESLYEEPSGVGLAAPQIGLQLQLAVIDIKRDGKSPIVLINPVYIPNGEEREKSVETCLSFQNYAGSVARYASITVKTKDLKFNDVSFQASGFKAFACQHEIDHLGGKVYVDKAENVEASNSYCVRLARKAYLNVVENTEG